MKHNPLKFLLLFICIFAISIAACTPSITINYKSAPTTIPGAIETYAAQTMMAKPELVNLVITQTPFATASEPSGTHAAEQINESQANQTIPPKDVSENSNPAITPTPFATATPSEPCNAGKFIADITIPDDTLIAPGKKFTKIWRLQNVGWCTWTDKYKVVFATGDQLNGPDELYLPKPVPPGESIDISIEFQAPQSFNCYQSNWLLADENGNRFGVGYKANEFFWVAVSVQQPGVKRVST